MPGNHLVFNAYNAEDVAPENYAPNVYTYRYRNGFRAELIGGFNDVKTRLEPLLAGNPHTIEQLARKLSFDRQLLQKILDFLFTHTGDIAALEILEQPTLYIWADRQVTPATRDKITLGAVEVDTDDYTAENLTAIASYLTILAVLNPPIELIDDAIEKCLVILDAAKLSQAFIPNAEIEHRVALLQRKHELLWELRSREAEKWAAEEEVEEEVEEGDEPFGQSIDELPDTAPAGKLYPYGTLYLLGSGQSYTGPELKKTRCIDDPELTTLSFANLSLLVIELDTFLEDLQAGRSILGVVETYLGTLFPSSGLTVRFRKIPGAKYKRNVERLMHEEILNIRKRGYAVIT